ncbi:hypothetical protein FRB90_008279, partial [Tulasnella sp. 427]
VNLSQLPTPPTIVSPLPSRPGDHTPIHLDSNSLSSTILPIPSSFDMQTNERAQCYIQAKSMIALSRRSFYASRLGKKANTKPISPPTPLALAPSAPTPGSAPPSPTHSAKSTESSASSCSSVFSRHSGETLSTDVGERAEEVEKGSKVVPFNAVHSTSCIGKSSAMSRVLTASSSPTESVADAESASEDDDDDSVVFIKTKKVGHHRPTFATSVSAPNPYAAFMRQPGYKGSYIFPSTRS